MADRCETCGQANRAGARFCSGCGVALAVRCGSCGSELLPGARFCDACGAPAPAAGATVEAVRRTVSVLFSDLAGSTAMQEALDPESVRQVMARYYEVMRAAVGRHEGHIEKFIGDAVVAVFGRWVVREDDALRAVRCAAAMVADLAELNDELERAWGTRLALRTGVNTGELVLSEEGILVGDTMNTAARFEQAAAAGEILLGETTWRLVRNHVGVEEVAPLELKGKSVPVRAWRLMSAAPSPGAAPVEILPDAPLVGRESELARLHAALHGAIAQRVCRLVTVVGSPGLGKSRLAEVFGREAAERAQVLRGHCEPSGEGNAFLPVAEVVREVSGIGDADTPEIAREKLRALAPAEDPDRERLVDRVAGVIGIGEPASPQETFWALRRGLEDLARRRPLVVVLDDLHWAQPMLLDLLEHLVEWIADAPVLVLALARPELREAREVLTSPGRRAADVIELEPLDTGESRMLLDGLLGAADLPPGLLARMLETTGGNPLFLGELVRMLVDEDALVLGEDGWAVAAGAESFDVPPTIQALLSARIERLPADERAVVERAAVIGQQFYRGAVAELLSPPVRSAIDGHLAALRRKEMVEPEGVYWIDEPVYRFHHVLIRDAAYRLLLKEVRAVLHERFADWLADKAGELVGEYEEVIAFHLEQAHAYRRELGPLDEAGRTLGARAAEHLLSAGRRALAREDLSAAVSLLSRAVACQGAADAEILWDLAEAVLSAGDATRGAEVVARYRAVTGEDALGRARAAVIEAQLANLTGEDDPVATAELVTEVARELRALRDGRGEAKAWAVVAQTNARLGRVARVETALDQALTAARGVEDRRRTTAVLAAAPRAALWGPSTVVRASGRCLDVVRILRMTPGSRHVEAVALRCQAVLEAMRGRHDAARQILAGARATLEELGLSLELNETRAHAGMVELLAGEAGQAVEHLREALAGFEALGADAAAAQVAALLSRALVARGEPGDAEAALARAGFAEEHGGEDLRTAIIAASARGEALAGLGRIEEAVASTRRAVELAEPTDALADKADASMALARVLLAAGDAPRAQAAARAAKELYESKGHAVGAAAAARAAGQAAEPVGAATHAATTGAAVLGDSLPERVAAELQRCHNARDYDALRMLMVEDCRIVDHRALGHREVRGRADVLTQARSAFEASPDLRLDIDEVLACGERAIALRFAFRGSGRKAGELEVRIGAVVDGAEGRYRSAEYFEPDDTPAILARFSELEGRPESLRGDEAAARLLAEIHWLQRARAYERLGERVTDDWYRLDHRALGWGELRGRDAFVAEMRSVFDAASDVREEVDEIIACDEHVIAAVMAWRSRGRKAGESEVRAGAVYLFRDGRWAGAEYFEPEDRAGTLARFAELSDRGERVLGHSPPALVAGEVRRACNARDYQRFAELVADDMLMVDHRPLGWGTSRGRDWAVSQARSIFDASPDVSYEYDEVLACDDRLLVVLLAWRGRGLRAGEVETVAGAVQLIEDGLWRSVDYYDPEDRQAMIARYAALGGGQSKLGDRPPEQAQRQVLQAFAARDFDRLGELFADEFVMVDHRGIGWEEIAGRDAHLALVRSGFHGVSDIRVEIDEVLACDDRVLAVALALRGTTAPQAGGGRFEILLGHVSVTEGGLQTRIEQFDPEDREGMLRRYRELGGTVSVSLGDRPPERWLAEYCRRFGRESPDRIAALYAPEITVIDRRLTVSQEPVRGIAAVQAIDEAVLAIALDARYEITEVLACDHRVIAARAAIRGRTSEGGGAAEVAFGVIDVIVDGHARHVELLDPNDEDPIIARFRELGGGILGERPSEQLEAELARLVAVHDADGAARLFAPGYLLTDHRVVAGEDVVGRDGVRTQLASIFAIAPDVQFRVDEVLACDDRVIAMRCTFGGHAADGGGLTEMQMGVVSVIEDGLFVRDEQFEPDDAAGMLQCFAALGGERGLLGATRSERIAAEHGRRVASGDLDLIVAQFRDDYVARDHRTAVSQEPVCGPDAVRGMFGGIIAMTEHLRWDVDEVLAADDDVFAARTAYRGRIAGGGEAELLAGQVTANDGERLLSTDAYDYDDTEAMLARFAELGGRRRALPGSTATERFFVEYHRLVRARDYAAIERMLAPGCLWVDHRAMAWEPARGRDGVMAVMRSTFDASPGVQADLEEVLASDDHVIAARVLWHGPGQKAGPWRMEAGVVHRLADGLWASTDFYDPDDRRAMIARYVELGGGLSALGDSPPERACAEHSRRLARRDLDAILAQFRDDYVMRDHRSTVSADVPRPEVGASFAALFSATGTLWLETDEVLAHDDRVIARRLAHRGTAAEGGGPFEVRAAWVSVVEDGLFVSTDVYEYDDDAAVHAQFAELSGGAAVDKRSRTRGGRGPRAPELATEEATRRYNAHDAEGWGAMCAEGFVLSDHRPNGWGTIEGPTGMRDQAAIAFAMSGDIRAVNEEVVACDDRVIALRFTWRGHADEGGGEYELPVLYVGVVENGLMMSCDMYEPEDRQTAIARYVELGGGLSKLGDSPPERVLVKLARGVARRDMAEMLACVSDEYRMTDHRAMGWQLQRGHDGFRAQWESAFSASPVAWTEVDEVLAVGDRTVAYVLRFTGRMPEDAGGGEYSLDVGQVATVRDGRLESVDQFDPDDRQAMLARFAELEPPDDRSTERWVVQFITAYNDHDPDAVAALVRDDFVLVDHRANGWGTITGPDELREHHAASFPMSPDIHMEIDSVLAGDHRVGAVCFTYRGHMADGGGEFEYSVGYVTLVEDGRALSTDVYEPEDRQTMIARYVELGGGLSRLGHMDSEQILAEWCLRYARRDLEQMMQLIAQEFTWVDHRPLSWESLDRQGISALTTSAWEEAADIRIEIDDVLAVDRRAIAMRLRFVGTGRRAGAFELPVGQVCRYQDGLCVSLDQYDYDDGAAMLARFAELSGSAAAGPPLADDRPPSHR